MKPIIVIPARLAATRLPDKPLAPIHDKPMIVHALERAQKADIGPVVVACADEAIKDVVERVGGNAILTRSDHPSGSDRIWEAITKIDPKGEYDTIINLQGDMPELTRAEIRCVLEPFTEGSVDIATLAAKMDHANKENENKVKAVISFVHGTQIGYGIYFSRAPVPWGADTYYHHVGIYAYRRDALKQFVALPPSLLERQERLEQLRALEAGMRIAVRLIDRVPIAIDTPEDLALARQVMR